MSIRTLGVVACLIAGLARADTVTFTSGKVIEDVTVKDEGDKVRLTKLDGSSSIWPKSMIKSVVTSADELIQRRKALPPKDANARVDLAHWCEEKTLEKEAAALYEEALTIDPACAGAHEALGHLKIRDRWFADVQSALIEIKKDPNPASTLIALGMDCKAKQHWEMVRRIASEALKTNPESRADWAALLRGTPLCIAVGAGGALKINMFFDVVEVSSPPIVPHQQLDSSGSKVVDAPLHPKSGCRFVSVKLSFEAEALAGSGALRPDPDDRRELSTELKLLLFEKTDNWFILDEQGGKLGSAAEILTTRESLEGEATGATIFFEVPKAARPAFVRFRKEPSVSLPAEKN